MSQKILIGIIAILIIIAVIVVISFSKSNPEKKETSESAQKKATEITPATLDESIKSLIEKFKLTCADFLAGDLRGDADADCPGFENPFIKDQCYYCFATKNQNPALCGKINDPGFKIVCQRATGSSFDEIINQ